MREESQYRLGLNARKNTRSDGRVGEHIANASPRDAKKCRTAKPSGETEYQKRPCERQTPGQ
jgi:hypothetical protein